MELTLRRSGHRPQGPQGDRRVEHYLDHRDRLHGIIARFLSPGPNTLNGFILTTALGIAGAFVATFIGQTIGWYRLDQGAGLIGATVGSLLVLFVWNRFVATRAPAAGDIREPGSSPRRWL
jgi:uncharacterized membrane protein YeaQ/YmgE (transglycosylase-associated protein family)